MSNVSNHEQINDSHQRQHLKLLVELDRRFRALELSFSNTLSRCESMEKDIASAKEKWQTIHSN